MNNTAIQPQQNYVNNYTKNSYLINKYEDLTGKDIFLSDRYLQLNQKVWKFTNETIIDKQMKLVSQDEQHDEKSQKQSKIYIMSMCQRKILL